MITIMNGPLTGRGDTTLTIETSGGASQPMSVAGIMETACYYRANMDAQADTADLATMRNINKILDVVENDGCCVKIEEEQYSLIRPSIENIITRSWPIHAPSVIDQLDEYENTGTACGNCSDSDD